MNKKTTSKQPIRQAKASKPTQRRRYGPALLGLVVAGAVLAMGVGPRIERNEKLGMEVRNERSELPLVSVFQLRSKSNHNDVILPCTLTAIDQTTISPRTSGYLEDLFVDIGSKVTAGQLLAVVEAPEIDQQVSAAQAQEAGSRAKFTEAQAEAEKMSAGVTAARSDRDKSRAGVMQARADLAHYQAKETQSEEAVKVAIARQTEAGRDLAGAKAELARANAGLSIAQKTLMRWRELFKANAVSGQDVDEKESDFDAARAEVESADSKVSADQAALQAATEFVHSAEADVVAAKADVDSGRQRIEAAQSVVASSEAAIQAAEASYAASRSGVQAAGANIASDEANYRRSAAMQSYERILAPFSGVITARNVEKGDLVGPGTANAPASDQVNAVTKVGMFGLARIDQMRAEVDVPEDAAASMREGQFATCTVQEVPNRLFHGRVSQVSGALDSTSRTLQVEVRIPNGDGALKPGMYAQVRFSPSGESQTLQVPATALIFDSLGTRVATVTRDGNVHFVHVQVAKDLGDQIVIGSGLVDGDTVITNPDDTLTEGQRVQVARGAGS